MEAVDIENMPHMTAEEYEIWRRPLKEARDRYYGQHKCCPQCASPRHTSTYMGYIMVLGREGEYKDENHVKCSDCGWKGITHDLKPRKENV